MKIVFNNKFHDSDYSNDAAAKEGRMEAVMSEVSSARGYSTIECISADDDYIGMIHDKNYIESVRKNRPLYEMALLAAKGTKKAGEIGAMREPAFAAVRPPGHHAYKDFGWGTCIFSNLALSLVNLKNIGLIKSALVVDIDAHTGDGTREVLKFWNEAVCFNPMAENGREYIKTVKDFLKDQGEFDILAISAGFDAYEKDLGKKLNRFDYYVLGREFAEFSNKKTKGKRFAVLEGGYYLPDLGKNVVSFCDGFEK